MVNKIFEELYGVNVYFVVIYHIFEKGCIEAKFSLHGCKTANFIYFKMFLAFV